MSKFVELIWLTELKCFRFDLSITEIYYSLNTKIVNRNQNHQVWGFISLPLALISFALILRHIEAPTQMVFPSYLQIKLGVLYVITNWFELVAWQWRMKSRMKGGSYKDYPVNTLFSFFLFIWLQSTVAKLFFVSTCQKTWLFFDSSQATGYNSLFV